MKSILKFLCVPALLTAAALSILSQSAAAGKELIVVELFTSQSCSSCPPADKLLGQLSKNEDIIALSCHVTYWNHLHWKDTLSREFCTDRQRLYNASLNRSNSFTPQMVINGNLSAVGSRSNDVNKKLNQAKPIHKINLSSSSDKLTFELPNIGQNAKLILIEYIPLHTQSIPSGENRGRTVTYTNPVNNIREIGAWDGSQQIRSIDVKNSASKFAIIAQIGSNGPILAAGKLD